MTSPFAGLAARVAAAWARADHAPDALAAIASEALAAPDPALPTTFDAIVDWMFADTALPAQRGLDEAFGQPPVTVYLDDRFFIELLFWHSGTTGIHQHAFTGAFRVLAGSSLHAVYDFAPGEAIDATVQLGALALRAIEVLETGAVRPIAAGPALIHSAFHLDNPSVTLVVRTHADASRELEYKPPGLAIDPSARSARTTKLMQLMGLLAQQPGDGYRRRVEQLIARGDAYTAIAVLLRARRQADPETYAALAARFAARFAEVPALVARVQAVADEELRRLAVTQARARIHDPQHRFLLALVMNLPDRDAVLAAIAQRYPDAPAEATLLGWLRACATRPQLGFELDDVLFAIVRGVVEGRPPPAIARGLRASVAEVEKAIAALRTLPVLAPLFVE